MYHPIINSCVALHFTFFIFHLFAFYLSFFIFRILCVGPLLNMFRRTKDYCSPLEFLTVSSLTLPSSFRRHHDCRLLQRRNPPHLRQWQTVYPSYSFSFAQMEAPPPRSQKRIISPSSWEKVRPHLAIRPEVQCRRRTRGPSPTR